MSDDTPDPYTFAGTPMSERDVLIAREGFKNGAHFVVANIRLMRGLLEDLYHEATEQAEVSYPLAREQGKEQ